MATAEIMTTKAQPMANWLRNANLLWDHRRTLIRVGVWALIVSGAIAFLIPKRYDSTARLMPPEQPSSGAAMLAAIAGHSLGGLAGFGNLAGLLGSRTSSALFIDLLRSRTISDHLIDRFHLQHVYKKRYHIDTVKYLAHHTTVTDDKKSGVITLTYSDTDPRRAQAIAQAYLEELNNIVTRANTSSARREREFIEKRLVKVQADLQSAEKALGQFSSNNVTLDVKEQTHAMVDAAARLQGELILAQSELDSLQQIYGEENVRVRAARARIGVLKSQLAKMSGSASPEDSTSGGDNTELYPSLRQLPRLAVPYADLYRRVRIQETVFELLSQQYEMARIEEAKDTPVVAVIDQPLIAEKKSFPPRLLLMLLLTTFCVGATSFYIVLRYQWEQVNPGDPRKILAQEISGTVREELKLRLQRRLRGK
ncbi:MAG TPA: Wzz/FepE/Etk N-terminal domain-containing protein [Acidobacteriaceae bacterium]|nr:Wzz/FepE/Etk N-terminal domain-containing protein [Acidobacteriaceae bacterium]